MYTRFTEVLICLVVSHMVIHTDTVGLAQTLSVAQSQIKV